MNTLHGFHLSQPHKEAIISFCQACCSEHIEQAFQLRETYETVPINEQEDFQRCCLLFGAQRDIRLVRYVVEHEKTPRTEILSSPSWEAEVIQQYPTPISIGGRSTLLFALDSGREDVVEYLLQEWYQSNVSVCYKLRTELSD